MHAKDSTTADGSIPFWKGYSYAMTLDAPICLLVRVTGEDAEQILGRLNRLNRTINPNHVDTLRREMAAEEWALTTEGLGFDANGHLVDGQHRLKAAALEGASFVTWAMFNLAEIEETALVMGVARPRRLHSAFRFRGVANYSTVSTAIKEWWLLLGGPGILRDSSQTPTHREAKDLLEDTPEMQRWAHFWNTHRADASLMTVRVIAHLLAFEHASDQPTAEEFGAGLLTGENLSSGDPRLALRAWLLKLKMQPGSSLYRLERAANTIQCWNRWSSGRSLKYWKPWDRSKRFPEIRGGSPWPRAASER